VTARHFYEGCHGTWKIFVLHLNVMSQNPKQFQPLTFQCSAQGTFHTNMQSSHFYLFKDFTNCFYTLIWNGGSNTSFGLIKGKCIIFLLLSSLSLSSVSFFGQFPYSNALGKPCSPTDTRNMERLCIQFVAQPICTNSSNLLQIVQSCSSTMVPGTDYSDIGFYCCYRL